MKGTLGDFIIDILWIEDFLGFHWLYDLLRDAFYWIAQVLLDIATFMLSSAASLMPSFDIATDGVSSLNVNVDAILSMIAWIFPFDALLFCLGLIGINYAAYFTAGPLLRWVNIIK